MISATLLHLHLWDLERVVRHGWWQWRISRKAGWGLCFETNSMKCCHTITHQIRSRFEQNLLAELLFFGSMILKSLRSSLALRCMMYTYIYIYTWYVYLYIYMVCVLCWRRRQRCICSLSTSRQRSAFGNWRWKIESFVHSWKFIAETVAFSTCGGYVVLCKGSSTRDQAVPWHADAGGMVRQHILNSAGFCWTTRRVCGTFVQVCIYLESEACIWKFWNSMKFCGCLLE